jgi:hypothetical protein
MGPYAEADYNLTLCPLQNRLQHIYHGQPYARVDFNPMPECIGPYAGADYITSSCVHSGVDSNMGLGNPMPESTLTLCKSRLQYIYHGNPMPESTLTLCKKSTSSPVRDFGFGLCVVSKQICKLYY